jgi:hypothetical protein
LESLDDLDAPFKSALLSMYYGVPQLGVDGQQHSLDEKVKISPDEGMWLYEECRKSKPERTLEIGLGYGFSTLFFLAAQRTILAITLPLSLPKISVAGHRPDYSKRSRSPGSFSVR